MSAIMNPVVKTAMDEVMKELKLLWEVKEQVEGVKLELQLMQSFLEDVDYHMSNAESEQQRVNRLFRQRVYQIEEASLHGEDIVATYLAKVAWRKRDGIVNLIRRYACIPSHFKDIHVVGSTIEKRESKLSTLRQEIGGAGPSSSSTGYTKSLPRRSHGHIHDRNIVGLDEEINEVIDLSRKQEIVSIYGMGGLGKTTLAKKIFHDKRVREHFDKFIWVYVSQQFKERDVWESTLVELTSPSSTERTEISEMKDDELLARLCQAQNDQKCIVVLDDVWNIVDWEKLRVGFQLEERGQSKILFTTRKKEVADHANCRGSYGGLKPLSDEKSFELLKKIALEGRHHEIADKKSVADLAKGMLDHCGGLLLAITVLGGILATKDSLGEWQTVHDNVNAYLKRGKGHNEEQGLGVHHVLAYSYQDLPPRLKTCFLYLGQFPEDYEIPTSTVTKMWIAEGFVSVKYDGEGEETVEDVAERYLNELVGRCVIEVGKKGSTGRIKTCRIHDLMRDVCLSKAKERNFFHNYEPEGMGNVVPEGMIRRLSMVEGRYTNTKVSLDHYKRYSQIRSLVLRYYYIGLYSLPPMQLKHSFKLLRMLLLEGFATRYTDSILKEIGKLVHLRYLSLRNSTLCGFPSLDKLGCMEILDLQIQIAGHNHPFRVGDVWKMKHLRHLYFPHILQRKYTSKGDSEEIESNPNLQTLINFPPRGSEVSLIVKFPNLRKLHIIGVTELAEILRNNEGFSFTRLYSLRAITSGNGVIVGLEVILARCPNLYKLDVKGPIEKLPQLNQFSNKLTKLTLTNSRIEDPTHIESTLGNLPNLKILNLNIDSFEGNQFSFKKGTFLQLKSLQLQWLNELNSWKVEEGAMPILEHLVIVRVRKLTTVPEGMRSIGTLNELKISDMPPRFAARLKKGGADFDKVKHVPSITFEYCNEDDT